MKKIIGFILFFTATLLLGIYDNGDCTVAGLVLIVGIIAAINAFAERHKKRGSRSSKGATRAKIKSTLIV